MEFYYGRVSGNSVRVAFGLHEAGASFTPHLVDTTRGQNRTAAYLALNPMGKVPAILDGEVRLWESNAINWYLAETHPEAGLLPASAAGRAAVQRWLFFQAGHVSPACVSIMMATNERVRKFWGVTIDPQSATASRKELARYLPVLEQALSGRDWLEHELSLADLAYTPHLWLIAEAGFDFKPWPSVRAWLDRLLARPAWQKAAALIFG